MNSVRRDVGRGRFRTYDLVPPTPDVAVLLAEIDRDPTGIFWG